jgi:hypothetical protein
VLEKYRSSFYGMKTSDVGKYAVEGWDGLGKDLRFKLPSWILMLPATGKPWRYLM